MKAFLFQGELLLDGSSLISQSAAELLLCLQLLKDLFFCFRQLKPLKFFLFFSFLLLCPVVPGVFCLRDQMANPHIQLLSHSLHMLQPVGEIYLIVGKTLLISAKLLKFFLRILNILLEKCDLAFSFHSIFPGFQNRLFDLPALFLKFRKL